MTNEWTSECTEAVKKYNAQVVETDPDKALNVYNYLKWLNESDPSVMDYLPKRPE